MQYYLIGDDWFEYDENGAVTATHHNYDADADIIIVAGETSDASNTNSNVIDYQDTHYDMGEAQRLLEYSGGFTEIQTSEVTGCLWEDNGRNAAGEYQEAFDYDGIRNTVTDADGATQFYEKGIANAEIQLEQYVLQNGKYVPITSGNRTVKTDADGKYTFSDVSTYAEINGEKVLAHYRLKLLSLPSGMESYAVTRYRQNGDAETQVVDSHLISQNGQHGAGYSGYDTVSYLTSPTDGDYFITAKKSQPETKPGIDGNTYFEPYILYDDAAVNSSKHEFAYDYIKAKDYDGYDGGLKAFETASVSGIVWEDTNYNGIQDEGESAYSSKTNPAVVNLQQYSYQNGKWVLENAAFQTHKTETDGKYTFSNLPTYVEKNGVKYLAGYQVVLKTLPEDYAATKYWNNAEPDKVYSKLYVTDIDSTEDSLRTSDLPITVLEDNHEMLILAQEVQAGTQSNNTEPYTDYNWTYVCGTNIKNIDTPNTAQQKYYDLVKARDYANLNAGLKQRETAAVKGKIWEDSNYNGILDTGEKGKSGVSVTLEQYRYDITAKQYVKMGADKTVTTDKDGVYQFTKVPTHFVVGGKDQLAYYRIRADVPEGYAVTRYRQATDATETDSDWIAETNYLTAPDNGDYFLTAQLAQGNDPYNLTDAVTNKKYDSVLNADVIDVYNGGLKAFETGTIQGTVWFDKNYSGLQETDESAMPTQQTVYLDQYYLDDAGNWQFVKKDSVQTDAKTGAYQFKNKPTFVTVGGKRYLAGYRLRLNAVPDGYAVTKYRALDSTENCINSDLLAASQDSNPDHTVDFNEPGEYILLAKQAVHGAAGSGEPGFHEYYAREYGNVKYDIVTAENSDDVYNGGLKTMQTAAMEGQIWNDANYDGTMDSDESGCKDLHLTLYQYYLDGTTWKKTTFKMQAVTDSDGRYHFNGIPTYAEVDGKRYLAGYQLHLDALPDGNAVTVLANDNKLHWDNGALTLMGKQEYLIVAAEAQPYTSESVGNTLQYNEYYNRTYRAVPGTDIVYDITESRDSKDAYLGGIRAFQNASISGRIWNDADYDGSMTPDERGMHDLPMTLEQYYWDGESWIPTAFTVTGKTDSDGNYQFDAIPTFVEVGGKRYLAGYQLKLDALPKDADGKITYGHKGRR